MSSTTPFETELMFNTEIKHHETFYDMEWAMTKPRFDSPETIKEVSKKFLEDLLYTYKQKPELLAKLSNETREMIERKFMLEEKVDEKVILANLAMNMPGYVVNRIGSFTN